MCRIQECKGKGMYPNISSRNCQKHLLVSAAVGNQGCNTRRLGLLVLAIKSSVEKDAKSKKYHHTSLGACHTLYFSFEPFHLQYMSNQRLY